MTEPMPPKVATAIAAVMGKITKLGKDQENAHAKYKFAGIDAFLELTRPLCAEAGLIITQDEESFEIIETADKPWLMIRYAFTLSHISGETWATTPRRTIMVQASMGAQAFGAAQSYAEKQFMRSLFQIATGENEDADTHAQGDLPTEKPMSAHQARKDGLWPPLEAAMNGAETVADLVAVCRSMRASHYNQLPPSWQRRADDLFADAKEDLEAAECALDKAASNFTPRKEAV